MSMVSWKSLDKAQQEVECSRCGWKGKLRQTHLAESGPHLKASCPQCETYLCFARRRTDLPASA